MGCTSSKQQRPRHDRRATVSPYNRSSSLPVPRRKSHPHRNSFTSGSELQHLVSLTSSTIGSLDLDFDPSADEGIMKASNDKDEIIQKAKSFSAMIDRRILKTPTITPPNEPETINAWELMSGLEDLPSPPPQFSFLSVSGDQKQSSNKADAVAYQIMLDFDASVEPPSADPIKAGIVKARIEELNEKMAAAKKAKYLAGGEGKVVFYFTSLRGIRKTYEDCSVTHVILKGYSVKIDERDVSMDAGFRQQLTQALGNDYIAGKLPIVFADGKYIGGTEEIKLMHEAGKLATELENCENIPITKDGNGRGVCERCGDVRFVPCETCSGSCKIFMEYSDDEDGDDEDGGEEGSGGFRRCPDCNENGLVRCSLCC